jgi:hypothetical protein
MLPACNDLERRRPLWVALSDLFLDNQLEHNDYRYVATAILKSEYSPTDVQEILWNEVFPAVGSNLNNIVGEWAMFESGWLENQILDPGPSYCWRDHPNTAVFLIKERLPGVIALLPPRFQGIAEPCCEYCG